MPKEFGLGKGLASLIPQKSKGIKEPSAGNNYFGLSNWKKEPAGEQTTGAGRDVIEVAVGQIVSNPYQPRKSVNEEKLGELVASIKKHGIIQPLIVSKNNGAYELVAGERRLEAAKLAGLAKVPVITREVDEQEKLELAIIENIQRHDLNPVEEAYAFQRLADEFEMSQEEIAEKMGKSRSSVANKLRLLTLPAEIQRALTEEKITEGHAKALLMVDDPQKQKALFDLILKNNLTVRQVENKTREVSVRTHKRVLNIQKDPRLKDIEEQLAAKLATKVNIQKSGGGGRIVIEYYSDEELNNLVNNLFK